MKRSLLFFVITLIVTTTIGIQWAISDSAKSDRERRALVDTRIDNNGYWKRMAEQGLAVLNPVAEIEPAVFTGSKITAYSVITDDSPDVAVAPSNSRQSENSIFIDPNDKLTALNSNNSGPLSSSFYGADGLYTFDGAETFDGSVQGAGGYNSGDPTTSIGTDGRWYVGFIASGGGQGVSYSDDQGNTWTKKIVTSLSSTDKNHLWIDTKEGSPYENYLYNSWVEFAGGNSNDIVVQRSTDNGETWDAKINISNEVNAGSHNQGVNLSTGPNGEVYAVWAIYDGWPQDEKAIGFAKSLDGGETWEPSVRIITNIRGIRNSGVPQNMRVNSFPAMAVDVSDGPNSGNIYVVWTNVGVPGQNSGSDRDIYMIKSTDEGASWSDPVRINQDEIGQGKCHYLPWIACDASNGILSVIFYDNRNTNANQAEAWVAVSTTAGEEWEDFKVSDVSFTPSPIPGFASGYMGDYLSIAALDGLVYPCWTDNRTGEVMTYVSVFETIDIQSPYNLQVAVNQENGAADLSWDFNVTNGFEHFNIYRNDELIGTSAEENFADQLPEYGYYTYKVSASYGDTGESAPDVYDTQWGTASIEVIPDAYVATVFIEDSVVQQMKIKNNGELELEFLLSDHFDKAPLPHYQKASGGGDEYISNVIFNSLSNSSGWEGYADYTGYATSLEPDQTYEINVFNGNPYDGDQCAVWVDWDQNGVFDEQAVTLTWTGSKFTGTITPDRGMLQGATGMRVRLAGPGPLSAYGDTEYGETEDYKLYLADWITLDPEEGVVAVGDSTIVNLIFNAEGMETGTYTDDMKLITNDINNSLVTIPVTMHVTDLQVSATASWLEICSGDETQLTVETSGGSGTFTYHWTSIPEGFESNEESPTVFPEVNTQYIVSVNDGPVTLSDTVEITVYSVPEVNLGDDQVLCGENEYELDAGNPGAIYLWSTGETSQTITVNGEGENAYWVEVTNETSCTASDTVTINFATLPVVELGADTIICHNSVMTLNAGNPGATYLWSTGEMTQTITVNAEDYEYGSHVFSVLVTSEAGCENDGEITVEIKDCTSIDENSQLVDISVFPNPSNGIVNVDLHVRSAQLVSVRVMNLTGQIVYQSNDINILKEYNLQIDLSQFSSGVYNIFVLGETGITEKKVVIRK